MMIKDLLNEAMITLDILDSEHIESKWYFIAKEADENE